MHVYLHPKKLFYNRIIILQSLLNSVIWKHLSFQYPIRVFCSLDQMSIFLDLELMYNLKLFLA